MQLHPNYVIPEDEELLRSKDQNHIMTEVTQDLPTLRRQAHADLDRLTPNQIHTVQGLMESMLTPSSPAIPFEDEPVSDAERAAINAGIASLEANGGISMEDLLADFGLTMAEFDRMPDPPAKSRNG